MICIYHKDCFDGMVAAWVIKRWFGESVKFIPATYGDLPPDVTGEEVIIVDFSYSPEVMVEMCKTAKKVSVLDHHDTAIEAIDKYFNANPFPDNIDFRLDLTRSGAGIAWGILYPHTPPPPVVEYAEDYDLWNFNLKNTRAFMAGMGSMPISFETVEYVNEHAAEMIAKGTPIVAKEDTEIKRHLDESWIIELDGYQVPISNVPRYLGSMVGEKLHQHFESDFSITYYDDHNYRYFRLRSSKRGTFDVQAIAKKFGGGGHKNAASFKRPRPNPLDCI